jgi:hypothetical protein
MGPMTMTAWLAKLRGVRNVKRARNFLPGEFYARERVKLAYLRLHP